VSARHRHIKNDIRDAERASEYLIMLIAAYTAVLHDPCLGPSEPAAVRVLTARRDELDVELGATRARATTLRKQFVTMLKKETP
jgi:hypothetical protein